MTATNTELAPLWMNNKIHGRIASHVKGELLHHGTSTEMLTRSDVREMMFEMRDDYEADRHQLYDRIAQLEQELGIEQRYGAGLELIIESLEGGN